MEPLVHIATKRKPRVDLQRRMTTIDPLRPETLPTRSIKDCVDNGLRTGDYLSIVAYVLSTRESWQKVDPMTGKKIDLPTRILCITKQAEMFEIALWESAHRALYPSDTDYEVGRQAFFALVPRLRILVFVRLKFPALPDAYVSSLVLTQPWNLS